MLFKLSDGLGDSGLSAAEQSCGAGERAGFDDADEYLHRGQAIHGYSFRECMHRPERLSTIREVRRFKHRKDIEGVHHEI